MNNIRKFRNDGQGSIPLRNSSPDGFSGEVCQLVKGELICILQTMSAYRGQKREYSNCTRSPWSRGKAHFSYASRCRKAKKIPVMQIRHLVKRLGRSYGTRGRFHVRKRTRIRARIDCDLGERARGLGRGAQPLIQHSCSESHVSRGLLQVCSGTHAQAHSQRPYFLF